MFAEIINVSKIAHFFNFYIPISFFNMKSAIKKEKKSLKILISCLIIYISYEILSLRIIFEIKTSNMLFHAINLQNDYLFEVKIT